MTPQERQVLADLFERIRSAAAAPRDAEAEAFIAEAVRAQPYAPYLLAQTALVQQHALDAAAQRIQELEAKAAQPAQESGFLGNLGRSLFGGGPPAPRPGYDASAYQRAPRRRRPRPPLPLMRPPLAPGARRPPRARRLPRQRDDDRDRRRRRPAGGERDREPARRRPRRPVAAASAARASAAARPSSTISTTRQIAGAGAVDAALPDAGCDPGGFQDACGLSTPASRWRRLRRRRFGRRLRRLARRRADQARAR